MVHNLVLDLTNKIKKLKNKQTNQKKTNKNGEDITGFLFP